MGQMRNLKLTEILVGSLNKQHAEKGKFNIGLTYSEGGKGYIKEVSVSFLDNITEKSYEVVKASLTKDDCLDKYPMEVLTTLDQILFDELLNHMLWSVEGRVLNPKIIPVQQLILKGYGRS